MVTPKAADQEQAPQIVEGDGGVVEDRKAADRRRRTVAQREKRIRERVCWWDGKPADYGEDGVVKKRGQSVPFCQKCYDRLAGKTPTNEPPPQEPEVDDFYSPKPPVRRYGSALRP